MRRHSLVKYDPLYSNREAHRWDFITMPEPIVLYSANTLLAYRINQRYYRETHFVWCNPYFCAPGSALDDSMPPSSTPAEICRGFFNDVQHQDQHSAKIPSSRDGLRRGALSRQKAGMITEQQRLEVEAIIAAAPLADFRPLLYVIPFSLVMELVNEVPPAQRAHPFSREYIVENLPRARFDVVEWQWR